LFELQLIFANGIVTMEEGGLHWRDRKIVASEIFSGYRVPDQGRKRPAAICERCRMPWRTSTPRSATTAIGEHRRDGARHPATLRGNQTMKNESAVHKLALFGGPKHIAQALRRYNPIGQEEVLAAKRVVESGVLSKFVGVWNDDFYGGPKVREFERACEKYFDVKHAITVNSWTSGLVAAVGAIGIEPGDEVIVSP
jgi:hypothetical protein